MFLYPNRPRCKRCGAKMDKDFSFNYTHWEWECPNCGNRMAHE